MSQSVLLQLAKQGDANAIAGLMNAALWSESIRVKARVEENCLHVMLRSPQLLNQHASIAFIRRGMARLQPESIDSVTAYAWKMGDDFPHWIAKFELGSFTPPTPERDVKSTITPRKTVQLPELKELARKGDALAIAILLNRITKPVDIAVKTACQDGCLHIVLEADQVPDRTLSYDLVTAELRQLQVQNVTTSKLYGRQKGHKTPVWTQTISLEAWLPVIPPMLEEVLVPVISSTTALEPDIAEVVETTAPVELEKRIIEPAPEMTEVLERSSVEPTIIAPPLASPPSPAALGGVQQKSAKSAVEEVKVLPKRKFSLMELGFAVAVAVLIYFMTVTP